MIRSVAVIGIGAMGAPMARRIQAAGFQLIVCDSNAVALAAFVDAGVRATSLPMECADADIVLIIVATPDQVRDVILGEQGVMAGVRTQRVPILAVMSTMSSRAIEDLARTLQPSAVRLIDAPVSGGALGAEKGTLTIMTGGNEQDIEAAKPVFACLGTQQFHCGALGAAQAMKIVNNVLADANAVIAAEAYRLAMAQGLDLAHVARVLNASSGRNFTSGDPAGPQAVYASMAQDCQGFTSLLAIIRKDVGTADDLASRAGGAFPAIRALKAVCESLGEETFAQWRRIATAPAGSA